MQHVSVKIHSVGIVEVRKQARRVALSGAWRHKRKLRHLWATYEQHAFPPCQPRHSIAINLMVFMDLLL